MTLPLFTAPTDTAWTVTQLARAARKQVEGSLGQVWVRGEVRGLKQYQSGHWYFSLRDAESQIRCVMWRTWSRQAGPPPAEGTEVFACGTPTIWEERGEFRLNITQLLATDGRGERHREFERVKKLLEGEGLFAAARKRALPALATCIAVVTSPDGAALRDIITVTRKRWPCVRLLVFGARVQGNEAEGDLVRALQRVNRMDGPELCIVGRGGGDGEDLWAFNREGVCRALAAVRVPTVSAVGHETDVTLCDFVADARAATPSAAAELAVCDREDLRRRCDALGSRLGGGLQRYTRVASERLHRNADRLEHCLEQRLERWRRRLEQAGSRLDALSPLQVLQRGYSMAQDAEGRVLRRVEDFPAGLRFSLRVADGRVPARADDSFPSRPAGD